MDSLLKEAGEGAPPSREAPKGAGRERKRKGPELSPAELQGRVIKLSWIVILIVILVGWAGGAIRRSVRPDTLLNNGVVDFVGISAVIVALYLLVRASRAGRAARERISPTEQSRLSYIYLGGILLWLVPIIGSFGYHIGLVFQTSAMHPIYYVLVGAGILAIMVGMSGSKERGTFFKLFMFAVIGILLSTVPIALPVFGEVLASDFWWSSTFLMVSIGFIFMAMTLRQMRYGQYSQLDEVLERADRAFAARRYDEAAKHYADAITLTHTLYSDMVFTGRNPRERGGARVPEEYFRPWIGKAKCLALSGKLRKALAIYELMLEVDPDNARVWLDRARILVAERRYAEAYISFDRAVKLDGTLEEAKEGRASVLEEIRKMAE